MTLLSEGIHGGAALKSVLPRAEVAGMDPAGTAALSAMVIGDALGALPLSLQVAVLGLLVATAVWAAVRPGALPLCGFVLCALLWSRANQRLEGAVLWTLSPEHGLTIADLLPPALAALVLARRRAVRVDTGRPTEVPTAQAATGPEPSDLMPVSLSG